MSTFMHGTSVTFKYFPRPFAALTSTGNGLCRERPVTPGYQLYLGYQRAFLSHVSLNRT